jgi:hypothetical protein
MTICQKAENVSVEIIIAAELSAVTLVPDAHYCYYHNLISQVSFPLVLLLNRGYTPLLGLQVSDCSTFLSMCDASSTAVSFL